MLKSTIAKDKPKWQKQNIKHKYYIWYIFIIKMSKKNSKSENHIKS